MDKERIEQRMAALQKQLDQTEANGNALIGAIQDCQYWLKQIAGESPNGADTRSAPGSSL